MAYSIIPLEIFCFSSLFISFNVLIFPLEFSIKIPKVCRNFNVLFTSLVKPGNFISDEYAMASFKGFIEEKFKSSITSISPEFIASFKINELSP